MAAILEEKNSFSRWQPSWKRKIAFQDGNHLGFRIETILAIFDLQVTPMLPIKFQVNWPFGSGEAAKIDFQDCRHCGHLGFPIGTILAIFYLQVTPMLPTKFQINLPFCSGEEEKTYYLGFPIGAILAIIHLQVIPMLPTKFEVNWHFGSGEEVKNLFS